MPESPDAGLPGAPDAGRPPAGWPPYDGEPVRVVLLGTYHMANPGNDVVNVAADDVLAADRQAQLRDLADRLVEWSPDRVAVEVPHDRQTQLRALYREYATGSRSYDRGGELPAPFRDDFARSEVVQVGFRVADRLDHDAVLAVDHGSQVPEGTTEEAMLTAMRSSPAPEAASYDLPDPEVMQARSDDRLADSTVREYLRWLNTGDRLRENHALMFASGLEHDDAAAAVGMLSSWYERSVRTVRTLWRRLDGDRADVLLVVGSGHVRVLRHLFDEAPMFWPASPLPLL